MNKLDTESKRFITTGLFFVFTGIIIGAFGAHGLKTLGVSEQDAYSFETGVRYLFYNGLGMLAIAGIREKLDFLLRFNFWMICYGTILFSFSIFALVFLPFLGIQISAILGPITPIGGSLMLIGWLTLFIKALLLKST